MADPTERQACYDDGIVFWANEIAAAIREVDPDANVTAGMWTADAHGREPVSGLLPDDKDPRRPPRPAVLTAPDCSLDFIDVHIYPWTGGPAVKRSAHERDAVIGHGAPALVGEYGVFKRQSAETAKEWLASMLRQAYEMGYAGSLFWVWDLSAIPGQTWSAVEAGMAEYVTELHRSGQLAPYRP
jgi:endo-1,4-beta-mannosidase